MRIYQIKLINKNKNYISYIAIYLIYFEKYNKYIINTNNKIIIIFKKYFSSL